MDTNDKKPDDLFVDKAAIARLTAKAEAAMKSQGLQPGDVVNIIGPKKPKKLATPERLDALLEGYKIRATRYTNREAEAKKAGDDCHDLVVQTPPCRELTGTIVIDRMEFRCPHFSFECPAGRHQYLRAATDFLDSLKLGERYRMSHFLHDAFIDDVVSAGPRRFAFGGQLAAGKHLLIGGAKGSGKTVAAIAIGAHARAIGREVLYLKAANFMTEFDTDKAMVEKAMAVQVLILDDVGTEMRHAKNEQTFFRVLDARLEHDRSTIITTNKPEVEFLGKKDARSGKYVGGRYEDERLIDRLETFLMAFTNKASKREKPGEK
jgi:chromosomal replication initiation ATPase DnaA